MVTTHPHTTRHDPGAGAADPVAFWEAAARGLDWAAPWHTAHTWAPAVPDPEHPGELTVPRVEWFAGGRLNVAYNCVDRHVEAGRGRQPAILVESATGERRALTYAGLQREVSRAANALLALGVTTGDRVAIYLPPVPEAIIAVLAAARIGAVHSLVFSGFSAEALRTRLVDIDAKVLVTADGQLRRGRALPLKAAADAAVAGLPVRHVLVVRRTGQPVAWQADRDVWWHDAVDAAPADHTPEAFDAESPLFIIHTSGTTGRPKGLVHTMGGYLTQAAWTYAHLFDPRPGDVHWCTADPAWVTAHTYVIYGPLANGATILLDEATPDWPHRARHAELIERHRVTTYYTAPTLVRTLATWFPDGFGDRYDLSSIRLLGSVGEPINPAAWHWLRANVGAGTAPVVDTWWQSETGATMVAPPRAGDPKPGSAGRPLPGISVRVVDESGADVPAGVDGLLAVDRPWPGMARTVWGDPERYRDAYWARFADRGLYVSGDRARQDADGDLWLLGRADEVINVSGHRLSTIEIESALVAHPAVAEAGVTGVPDATTGQAVAAFVVLAAEVGAGGAVGGAPASQPTREPTREPKREPTGEPTGELGAALRGHVSAAISPIARPRDVVVVPDLPKTRSGKILRRLLADLVAGVPLGDTTSLADPTVIDRIAAALASHPAGDGDARHGTADGGPTDKEEVA